jgi:hypothetical protein
MTAVRSHFSPDIVRVKQGDTVHLHVTNVEQAHDATHGLAIGGQNINVSLEPGKHCNITFVADKAGVYPFYCTEFCSALHLEMAGYLLSAQRSVAGPLPLSRATPGPVTSGLPVVRRWLRQQRVVAAPEWARAACQGTKSLR